MTSMGLLGRKNTMDKNNISPPETELQITIKPLMSKRLRRIAEIEGVDNPAALLLLKAARLINEKENEYRQRGIRFND
jgi:hypothetical protein